MIFGMLALWIHAQVRLSHPHLQTAHKCQKHTLVHMCITYKLTGAQQVFFNHCKRTVRRTGQKSKCLWRFSVIIYINKSTILMSRAQMQVIRVLIRKSWLYIHCITSVEQIRLISICYFENSLWFFSFHSHSAFCSQNLRNLFTSGF